MGRRRRRTPRAGEETGRGSQRGHATGAGCHVRGSVRGEKQNTQEEVVLEFKNIIIKIIKLKVLKINLRISPRK